VNGQVRRETLTSLFIFIFFFVASIFKILLERLHPLNFFSRSRLPRPSRKYCVEADYNGPSFFSISAIPDGCIAVRKYGFHFVGLIILYILQ